MSALHMLKLNLRLPELATWAYRRGLAGPGGDLGYALHAALAAAFSDQAPKPFRLQEPRPNACGGEAGTPALYGYCAADELALRDNAALAEPDLHAALGIETLAVKPMPERWQKGRILDFEVRIRPVVRCDLAGDRSRSRERDAFLAALTTPGEDGGGHIDREAVYREWLGRELDRDGAAAPLAGTLRMTAFHRTRVRRRRCADTDGRRAFTAPEGPDALFTGSLQVLSSAAFTDLLRRGIGRHRAFGFGMLLLRPRHGHEPC